MSTFRIDSEVTINSTPGMVWQILTDFPAYAKWNPFIVQATGSLTVGKSLQLRLRLNSEKELRFSPTISDIQPDRELRWIGRLLIPKLFDGSHSFVIEKQGPNKVRLIQQEEFNGILVGMLRSKVEDDTRAGFERMNNALKSEAEQRNQDFG